MGLGLGLGLSVGVIIRVSLRLGVRADINVCLDLGGSVDMVNFVLTPTFMISKSQIRFIKSLTINKFRKVNQQFIVEGPKMVDELIKGSFKIEAVYGLPEWIDNNQNRFSKNTVLIEVTEKELGRISALKSPNQVLAVVHMKDNLKPEPQSLNELILMLDDIKDPGNMGTIIRTADWFGIKHIICSKNCVDIYNPKVVQATMGSLFRVKIFYTDLKAFLEQLPNDHLVYGTLLEGKDIFQSKLEKKGVIITGSESHGISKELLPFITNKITIPKYSNESLETAESLNASTATAIVCAEFRRQSKL